MIAELAIDGDLALGPWWPSRVAQGEPVVQVGDLLQQIADVRKGGARVILLDVSCMGGEAFAAIALFDALREFAESGGVVIAFVDAGGLSTGALVTLCADFIVSSPGAFFHVHGASTGLRRGRGLPPVRPERVIEADVAALAIVATQSLIHPHQIVRWIERPYDPMARGLDPEILAGRGLEIGFFDAPEALGLGFIDTIGTRDDARLLCESLENGGALPVSSRRSLLAARDPAHLRAALAPVRARGKQLRGLLLSTN